MTSEIEKKRLKKMLSYERNLHLEGYKTLAGVDEAGRGPLAGPVVAAACILPLGLLIEGIDDSKKLTPKKRRQLFETLISHPSIIFGIGIVESVEIDRINIYQATLVAMKEAIDRLSLSPDYLLVDGMKLSHRNLPYQAIVKGDQLSLSIAAASIIAKETRDGLMERYDAQWPHYGFLKHKGYGTPQHLVAIKQYGPTSIHRRSFEPIKSLCALSKVVQNM